MKFSRSFFPTIQTPFPSKFPSATSKNLTLSLLFRLSYFLLHFDTSPPVLSALSSRLRADPRVVKWTTLKLGSTLSSLVPPGLSGGDANANFNNPSSVRKMSKVFGDDLMRDLEGSKMAETLKKDLENEILASENGKFKALDEEERKKLVESLWEEVKGDVEREVTEDVGDAVLKGRSIVLGGRMIKED